MPFSPVAVTKRLARLLEELGVPYFVTGSVASIGYGSPRMTHDVDFVARLGREHTAALVAALEADYYIDARMVRDAIEHRGSFNIIDFATMDKADVFVAAADAWTQVQFDRRQPGLIDPDDPDSLVFLAPPEVVVLSKLGWYESGSRVSEQQWKDVLGILRIQGETLDTEFMREWASRLGLSDLFERAAAEARLPG